MSNNNRALVGRKPLCQRLCGTTEAWLASEWDRVVEEDHVLLDSAAPKPKNRLEQAQAWPQLDRSPGRHCARSRIPNSIPQHQEASSRTSEPFYGPRVLDKVSCPNSFQRLNKFFLIML